MNVSISSVATDSSPSVPQESVFEDAIYYRLFDEAETIRWRMVDIPWSDIRMDVVTPPWIALAKEITYTELSPFNATAQYLQNYAQHVDFTQWLTVWLYEEMKHPQAMIRWLHQVGERVDYEFIHQGRHVTTIPSLMATLVTNVYAEILAWSMYMHISRRAPEPVFSRITRLLAGDEARHASGFYAYATKLLATSVDPDRERLAALKVMYFWSETNERVEHPVNLFLRRMRERPIVQQVIPLSEFDACAKKMYARVYPLLSNLLGMEIKSIDDVVRQIRTLKL